MSECHVVCKMPNGFCECNLYSSMVINCTGYSVES